MLTIISIESTLIIFLNTNSSIIANEIKNVIKWKIFTKDSTTFIALITDNNEISIKPE
jgi:hypothetical protein